MSNKVDSLSDCDNKIKALSDFDNKLKAKTLPTEQDKEMLLHRLNRQLSEDDHIYLFTEILQNMSKKIYTITENGTLFDLNDLDVENFWKMAYYTQLSISNHDRQKEIEDRVKQKELEAEEFKRQSETNLLKYTSQPEVIDEHNLTEYDQLRIDALKQCTYSTYAKKQPIITKTNEHSVYSNNFQNKWKQNNKSDEIAKKVIRITCKQPSTTPQQQQQPSHTLPELMDDIEMEEEHTKKLPDNLINLSNEDEDEDDDDDNIE